MPDNDLFTLSDVKADKAHDYILQHQEGATPIYRRVMPDDEIAQAAMEEWVSTLAQLWIAFGKQVDADQLLIYQQNLAVVPMGLLDAAVKRVIREHTFNNVPTIAEVWGAVRRELRNPVDLDRAMNEWASQKWSNAVYVFDNAPVNMDVVP